MKNDAFKSKILKTVIKHAINSNPLYKSVNLLSPLKNRSAPYTATRIGKIPDLCQKALNIAFIAQLSPFFPHVVRTYKYDVLNGNLYKWRNSPFHSCCLALIKEQMKEIICFHMFLIRMLGVFERPCERNRYCSAKKSFSALSTFRIQKRFASNDNDL